MTFRVVAGVVVGIVAWWLLFLGVGIAFGLLWGDYRLAARAFFSDQDGGHFTTAMLLLNWLVFIIAGAADGWLVSLISRKRIAGLVVAALYLLYTLFDHYYLLWHNLPTWYNLIVPWVIAGSILIGSRLVRPPHPRRPEP